MYPSKPAYVFEHITRTWGEVGARVNRFASALHLLGVGRGDVVSVMAPNAPPMYEAHFAVPSIGAVLHSINTRLDVATVVYQLKHSEPKVLIVDNEFTPIMREVIETLHQENIKLPTFISIGDAHFTDAISKLDYEDFLKTGDTTFTLPDGVDEWDAISLNYTSGTTGNPKGVVCHHRGAYLNSVSNIVEWNMEPFAKLFMIVPMFHCNGWNFTWTMANVAGCCFFVRHVRPESIFDIIDSHKVGYMCGAPITMITMLNYPQRFKFSHTVKMLTGGAPPPPPLMKRFTEETGVSIRTSYGLTESYGPATLHHPDPEWTEVQKLSEDTLLARCTVQAQTVIEESVRILNPETMQEVPADGATLGEVMIRGNIMMKGYFKSPEATQAAFKDGWFHTGDLAVSHGRGRFEIKDRSKDIIISGGENISSIQVETVLITHPGVMEVAVVAMPHEKWGEVPCAFVARDPAASPEHRAVTEAELIAWARTKMAHWQAPKKVIFSELPKTATGKVQKNILRTMVDN
eukprot:gene18091-20605_t